MFPKKVKFIKNPYQKWSDINPKLPKNKIKVYGPPQPQVLEMCSLKILSIKIVCMTKFSKIILKIAQKEPLYCNNQR